MKKRLFPINSTVRPIERAALLHDATGHPAGILKELPEIAAKGYHAVEVFVLQGQEGILPRLCAQAVKLRLAVWVITNYMKYQDKYIAEHPAQRLILAREAFDQDRLSASTWGCPFNPQFKARHLAFLRRLASPPAVSRIGLNDEALLLSGCHCRVCRADYAREIGGKLPLKVEPQLKDWRDPRWRRYLKWRLERWNHVHAELARAIHEVNPRVQVYFQASPASDLWLNPWHTGVDLSSMVQSLDGLCTDPYYTFHERHFTPAEVYLGEWCRFLRGIVPEDKDTEIVPQGFSHPSFTRPLGREDGLWSALIPPACGINKITPYTYPFQKCSPVQETYEDCFKLDRYFERTVPLKYAAVVHGAQTEIYCRPLPLGVPGSYDGTRVLPVTDALRQHGIPYAYLPDTRLDDPARLHSYRVLILPEINALSDSQAAGVRQFVAQGGNLVILGALGTTDENGGARRKPLLEEMFGIRVRSESTPPRRFRPNARHPAVAALERVDEAGVGKYMAGAYRPLWVLNHTVEATVPAGAKVLAEFTDDRDRPTGQPAIVSIGQHGQVLWLAGFPSRTTVNPAFKTSVLNRAPPLFARFVEWAAGGKPCLRVEKWPPAVPMTQLRPFDHRFSSTFEFFPLIGADGGLGMVTSYFKEPAAFSMVFDPPDGRRVEQVHELIDNRRVAFTRKGRGVRIEVPMGFDTPARVFWFAMK